MSSPATVTINVVNSLYQNPAANLNCDVNGDGVVSPVDALIVINDLQRNGTRVLPPNAFTPPPFLDVNGNGSVDPLDVLQVINFLNRRSSSGGEGEASTKIVAAAPSVVLPKAATSSQDVAPATAEQTIQAVGASVVNNAKAAIQSAAIKASLPVSMMWST